MEFKVCRTKHAIVSVTTALLVPNEWDDYSFRTMFELWILQPDGRSIHVGSVKILARTYADHAHSLRRTEERFPKHTFTSLDSEQFCSLGQSSDYYRKLSKLLPEESAAILEALNDVCFSGGQPWWLQNPGFSTSLLRTNSANFARRDAVDVFEGRESDGETRHIISFQPRRFMCPDLLEFHFNGALKVPGRVHIVIGRNGTGKTTLLAELANWFGQGAANGAFDYKPEFSRVVVMSFNPHDTALRVEDASQGNVSYVGSRPASRKVTALTDRLPKLAEASKEDWEKAVLDVFPDASTMQRRMPRSGGGVEGRERLEQLRADDEWRLFLHAAFEDEELVEKLVADVESALDDMSAGQRVLAELYAALFLGVERKGLILIDEPENHLHPSLIARFARALNELLTRRRAFAIVTTHSPIMVQETPAKFVTILERSGEVTTARRPPFETFGESIENITEHLFDTDFRSSHWKRVLRDLAESGQSIEEIQREIGDLELPLLARSYVAYFVKKRSAR